MFEHVSRLGARKASAALIAAGHFSLFLLAVNNLLQITVPSEYAFLQMLGGNNIWIVIHLFCAIAIAASLLWNKRQVQALSMSAGFMGTWGFLSFLAALTAIHPVSLAGPVLGMVLAAVAYIVAVSWASAPRKHSVTP